MGAVVVVVGVGTGGYLSRKTTIARQPDGVQNDCQPSPNKHNYADDCGHTRRPAILTFHQYRTRHRTDDLSAQR